MNNDCCEVNRKNVFYKVFFDASCGIILSVASCFCSNFAAGK